jgi:SAM-dependent methyltransferase
VIADTERVGHDHHASSGEHADWTAQLDRLEREGEINSDWTSEAIEWLASSAGRSIRRVIDVGCGPGVASVLFAQAFPSADVIAYDGNAALLDRARERAVAAGVGERLQISQGHIGADMTALAPADLIWASRVVHHLPEPTHGLALLGQLLRPSDAEARGGLLALVEGGLPLRVLPGGYGVSDPGFISRLDAASTAHAVGNWGMTTAALGGARNWPLLLEDAGLQHVASRTFLLDRPAPLDEATRNFVVRRFTDLQSDLFDQLSADDAAALARLVDPDDPAALINRPDLFLLWAHTVHVARRTS